MWRGMGKGRGWVWGVRVGVVGGKNDDVGNGCEGSAGVNQGVNQGSLKGWPPSVSFEPIVVWHGGVSE